MKEDINRCPFCGSQISIADHGVCQKCILSTQKSGMK